MSCCSNHGSNHGPGHDRHKQDRSLPVFWIGLIGLGGVLVYLNWNSLAGLWPYLLLLACPLMHLFMHKSHHGKQSDPSQSKPSSAPQDPTGK